MLVVMALLGTAVIFVLGMVLIWLWLFCERDWIGVLEICFGAALVVSGFVFGGW